ncbi:MAG: hypothetical protein HY709_12210 [Candidatus Latescibacteria bacterium]|nr:hypothetical protein [Candidatus Latescibacterota bacterium]
MRKKYVVCTTILFSLWGLGCYTILTHPRIGFYKDGNGEIADSLRAASVEEADVRIHEGCLHCHTGRHVATFYHDPFYDDEDPSFLDDRWYVPRRSYSYDPYYERWRLYSAYPWWLSRDDDYYRRGTVGQDWRYPVVRGMMIPSVRSDSVDTAKIDAQEYGKGSTSGGRGAASSRPVDREWRRKLPSGGFRLPAASSSSPPTGTVSAKQDSVQSSPASPSKPTVDDEQKKEENRLEKRKTWRKGKGLD